MPAHAEDYVVGLPMDDVEHVIIEDKLKHVLYRRIQSTHPKIYPEYDGFEYFNRSAGKYDYYLKCDVYTYSYRKYLD